MTSSPTPLSSLIPSASRPPGPTGSGSRTLAMAQSMGLVRSRSLQNRRCPKPSVSPHSSPVMPNGFAGFSFLIVIDFESTCWAEKGPGCFPPEIIEFPAVLLDTQTGHILDEFHSYVLPTETLQLSEFCTQLTGIRQDQVDTQGVPLPTCLYLFAQWMRKIQTHWNIVLHETRLGFRSTTFVTWSDWDFLVCLNSECRRKRITKPDMFNAWVDLRFIYTKFYARKPKGLQGALQDVGLQFEGREHSGLCDARNTAKLAWHLIQDGCTIGLTKVLGSTRVSDALRYQRHLTSKPPNQ